MSQPTWTDAEKLAQARLNGHGFYLTTMVFLKQQGISLENWATSLGEQFAPGWHELKGASAFEITKQSSSNFVSMGGTIIALEGDEKKATVVLNYPMEEIIGSFNLSVDEFYATFIAMSKPIFEYLGINFTSQRDGERLTFEFAY